MPFFSVIIPNYNRAGMVDQAVDSVLAQEFQDREIIVVDDGSTDNSLETLSRYGSKIKVVCQKNAGPGAARNRGVWEARGEYVAFLDSDDLWFPWTLATYKQTIDARNHPSIVAGPRWVLNTAEGLGSVRQEPLDFEHFSCFFRSPRKWFQPSGVVVRRDILEKAGAFSDASCEDIDIWLRLGTTPGFVEIRSPICYAYREHTEGISKTRSYRYAGTIHLIEMEKAGNYGGGDACRQARVDYVCQSVRPISLFYLRGGMFAWAFDLYFKSFLWHVSLGRIRYLFGFPVLAAVSGCRRMMWQLADAKRG